MNASVKKIKIGTKFVFGLVVPLGKKNLVIIRGSKGYLMCGYLDLRTGEKLKEVAVKIKGVSGIEDTLKSRVFSCTSSAKKIGIYKNQPITDVLKIIA
jgi:uncharacterized protein YunC (DUF1805 family)